MIVGYLCPAGIILHLLLKPLCITTPSGHLLLTLASCHTMRAVQGVLEGSSGAPPLFHGSLVRDNSAFHGSLVRDNSALLRLGLTVLGLQGLLGLLALLGLLELLGHNIPILPAQYNSEYSYYSYVSDQCRQP
jgi:hypothetical protein